MNVRNFDFFLFSAIENADYVYTWTGKIKYMENFSTKKKR